MTVLHLAASFNHNILESHTGCQNPRILWNILACDQITEFFKNSRVQREN